LQEQQGCTDPETPSAPHQQHGSRGRHIEPSTRASAAADLGWKYSSATLHAVSNSKTYADQFILLNCNDGPSIFPLSFYIVTEAIRFIDKSCMIVILAARKLGSHVPTCVRHDDQTTRAFKGSFNSHWRFLCRSHRFLPRTIFQHLFWCRALPMRSILMGL
jgi:hypothetical protein